MHVTAGQVLAVRTDGEQATTNPRVFAAGEVAGVGGAQQRPHFRRGPAEVLVIVETHQPLDAEAPAELGVGRTRNVRLETPDILRHEAGVTVIHGVRG